ncbi:PLD nuclease N-terminal domain-containing protein [Halorubrum sp. DTA98]|uniref:PLD nuclease N-terminal domain-containing protein n=1 Tax=Halorubrum sp. DTA98 TaxID=3402163 RepID=UPI003AAC5149
MDAFLLAVLVGLPLAWLIGFAAYAYVDAPRHGMNPKKWAAIAFFVPLFGFFAYLFEREERSYDPDDDPYAAGETTFAVHESRRGEDPLGPAGTETADGADGDGADDDGADGDGADDDGADGDEPGDPPGTGP